RPALSRRDHSATFTTTSSLRAENASASSRHADFPVEKIRNIGIIAHIDAGKTTTTERMLYYAGYTTRIGDVDDGSTVTDYLPSERARGITITSACIPLLWHSHRLNLIDTPGHIDFTIEVERSIRVLDGCIVILDGVRGVEAQTERVWLQANRYGLPRVCFVNKMDREGASLSRAITTMEHRLTGFGEFVVLQLPLVMDGSHSVYGHASGGDGLEGVVDLVTFESVRFDKVDTGAVVERRPLVKEEVGERLWEESGKARAQLVEKLAAAGDDAIVEAFLEADGDHAKVEAKEIKEALRRLTVAGKVVPVLMGAAFRNLGVQPVMDAVLDYLPSPDERPPVLAWRMVEDDTVGSRSTATKGKKRNSTRSVALRREDVPVKVTDSRTVALAFKVIHDEKRGALVFVRVYSGRVDARASLYNATRGGADAKEKCHKVLQMYADDLEELGAVTAGNIACLVGLQHARTGDTLLLAQEARAPTAAIQLDNIPVPPPVFVRSVEPMSGADAGKLEKALQALVREDPSLVVTEDPETRQTLLAGMGELHLEIAGERLRDVHRCEARLGKVMISYRETVPVDAGALEGRFVNDKETFGKRAWCEVAIRVEGIEDDEGVESEGVIGVPEDGEDANDVRIAFNWAEGVFPSALGTQPHPSGKGYVRTAPPLYPTLGELESALLEGCRTGLMGGPVLGFPLANVRVTVTDLKLQGPDVTSTGAVRAAVTRCLMRTLKGQSHNASATACKMLEPVMRVSVTVPERYLGVVTKDMTGTRRGDVVSVQALHDGRSGGVRGDASYEAHVMEAVVPLGSLVGYSTGLRGLTAGTGAFTMRLIGYRLMAGDREAAVIKEMRGY
ncbi:Ribosome-releasing factor 2, mitochondrial, partial [Irineochytrium annulatum]